MFAKLSPYGELWLLPVVKTQTSIAKETMRVDANGKVLSENANTPGHVVSLKNLSPKEREGFGWFEFVEERCGPEYVTGDSVETIENHKVMRRWPNKTLRKPSFIRDRRNADVGAKALNVMNGGMIHNKKNWATDEATRNLIMLMSLKPIQDSFRTQTMEGIIESMNVAEASLYVEAVATHVEKTNVAKFDHLEALSKIDNSQALMDYDISTGWPENPILVPPDDP
jgi:hypothetical protein